LVGSYFEEALPDWQMRIVPSLRSGVLWLLSTFPLGFPGAVLRIIQVIGAVAPSRVLGASSEEVGLELTFLALELFDFLLYRGDALQGIAMATLPVFGLLAEAEVLTSQSLYFIAQLGHFPAQVGDQIREGPTRVTDLYKLAIHDHLGLTRMAQKEKRLVPFQPDQKDRVDVLGEALPIVTRNSI